MTPNLTEFLAAGGQQVPKRPTESARSLLVASDIGAMLLTRSEKGMSLIAGSEN